MASSVRISDGTFDFSQGVDSGKIVTVVGEANPNGLTRNQLAWMSSCTVRGGAITPRFGFQSLAKIKKGGGLYQSGYMYNPAYAYPYLVVSISGVIYQINIGADYTSTNVVNLTAKFPGTQNPTLVTQGWMSQGETFLVIQAGDLTSAVPTLPLFWDGTTLRRSKGITNTAVANGTPGVNEIPAAGPMIYYSGRMWYAQGRQFSAGDIVYGNSGTLANNFRDAILNVTENPLSVGGDGFAVPSSSGNITALYYAATMDTSLGQGSLYVSTPRQIFQLTVPISRANWIAAGNNNQPSLVIVQLAWGTSSDRCVAHVNGDVFYQTGEPAIRSYSLSQRQAGSWVNIAISRNIERLLNYQNRAYMNLSNGCEFDNRLLMALNPTPCAAGICFPVISSLDFDIISTVQSSLNDSPSAPAWEGAWEGLNVLQLFNGVFGNLPRCFAVTYSSLDGSIELWELTDYLLADQNPVNGITDSRINWLFETPAYTWDRQFDMKELDGGEIWVDQVSGTVDMTVKFRVDGDPCWQFWAFTSFCAARNTNEMTGAAQSNYPGSLCQGWKFPVTLPAPQLGQCQSDGSRPSKIGYQFQVQVQIRGWCRIRGMILHAIPKDRRVFEGINCSVSVQGAT